MERLDDSNSKTVCTDTSCIDDDDDKKITCTKCKRSVHFLCTNLPIYQLRLFFYKELPRIYLCELRTSARRISRDLQKPTYSL